VPSSPVIPFDDPTILFTNAGMNQFKDVFTGRRKPVYPRATSSQKCIRAGGKHNDLDNVGFTDRHHTFFEMLGNFSFGDYFKEIAIEYAWEWVTKDLGLPKDHLYATVYHEDDEAFELWEKVAPELRNGRVLRFGKKDNYWSMGDIGPAGPCSEIHIDRGEKFGTSPQDVVNGETERYIEIWNLVFMQFDQTPDGKLEPLPKPSVDTGAGLERIAAIMQHADSNFGIDIFQNIISAISDITGSKYQDNVSSHHVIADHIRALAFSIADGAGISNEGRGYVLRRILRRAARHGRNLGAHDPFMYKLVPVLATEMGDTYPELREKQTHIENVIKVEEESFGRTLDTGLQLFDQIAAKVRAKGTKMVDGRDVFRLYDTYGFPYDLTEIIASEKGLALDREGFESAMAEQQERSRAAGKFESGGSEIVEALDKAEIQTPATEFVRSDLSIESKVLGSVQVGDRMAVILDRTPFYAEAGGQIADTGMLRSETAQMRVEITSLHRGMYVHEGAMEKGPSDEFSKGAMVAAEVDAERRWDIMRNHTATHLAHAALRKVLGEHVKQSGSYVGPDRMRFDFSHHQPMTADEIAEVERIVNEQILRGATVRTEEMPVEQARKAGAMALFGEKYADMVRVVSVPGFSMELCGGTHVQNVSQIGPFFIVSETGIASGVRRLEAVTGHEAQRYMFEAKKFRSDVSQVVGRPEEEALDGVRQLKEANSALQKELKKAREAMFSGSGGSIGKEITIGPIVFTSHDFGVTDRDTMAAWVDKQKEARKPVVAVALGEANGKRTFIAAASQSAVKEHRAHVGNLARKILPQFGGRGGGKPSFAQGGVDTNVNSDELFRAIKQYLEQ
jgi:alanyl-tRNA synthetase